MHKHVLQHESFKVALGRARNSVAKPVSSQPAAARVVCKSKRANTNQKRAILEFTTFETN